MPLATAMEFENEIQIRNLESHTDFQQAEKVQQRTWKYEDLEVVPSSIFSVAHNFGGQAIGAFDREEMVGFALSLGSVDHGHGHFHSHMVAVVPEYQNRGIGKLIKIAQREDALRRGITKIIWTFDPLQIRNAHLNFSLLGGTSSTYLPNLYGCTSSPLHGGIPTDRLVVEWNLRSAHVIDALEGRSAAISSSAIEVPVPMNKFSGSMSAEQRLGVQTRLRESLLRLFREGLAISGFNRTEWKATYILQKLPPI